MVCQIPANFQYVRSEILKESNMTREEWNTVESHWDVRVMGVWNVRCRVVAMIQLLRFYQMVPLYDTFMAWVKANPKFCKAPSK